jgi:hypothetical protein
MLEKLDITKIPTQIPEVLRKVLSGQVPSPAEFIEQHLAALSLVQAAILLAAGLIFLIYGWQAFRLMIIANGAFLGGLAGAYLAGTYVGKDMALFGLLAGGLLLAVLVVPLIRYVVALAGGLAGSYAGYHAWPNLVRAIGHPDLAPHLAVGALIGLVVVGLLCFLTFRLIVMVITSVEGAMLAVSGGLALCLHHAPIAQRLRPALTDNRFLLPMLFTIPSVIGVALQYHALRQPSSSQGGGGGKSAGAAA